MYLLDSSAIIEILDDTEKGKRITRFCKDKKIYITSFSIHEVLYGDKNYSRSLPFFETIPILNFDELASYTSLKIRKDLENKGKMINMFDVFIASIVKSNNLTIITLDKHFKNIKEIKCKVF